MMLDSVPHRLRLARHHPDTISEFWDHLPPRDARLDPIMSRIAAVGEAGLMVNGVIFDFLATGIAPLRAPPRPAWLYPDFNDAGRTRRGPGSDVPHRVLKMAYKLLTGVELPSGFDYPEGAGPLRLLTNKYDIINSLPKMDARGLKPDRAVPSGGPPVGPRGSRPGGGEDRPAGKGKEARPPSPPSSDRP